jgi:probable HAF family extracellular repeat protein
MLLALAPMALAATSHPFLWDPITGWQDLGTLGGTISGATGINDNGQVVGTSSLPGDATNHIFIWEQSTGMVDIGGLAECCSEGNAINNLGDVVGDSVDASGRFNIIYWSPGGGFVSLGSTSQPVANTAYGVNDQSEVTGVHCTGPSTCFAFVWSITRPVLHRIDPLPGGTLSSAAAINNSTHIVGGSLSGASNEGFVWLPSRGAIGLGIPNGAVSENAIDINDNDEIVGFYTDFTNPSTGYYWSRATRGLALTPLQAGDSVFPYSINNAGQIVGTSGQHAVLWQDHNSAPQDLGLLPGAQICYPKAINNLGQVVGHCYLP